MKISNNITNNNQYKCLQKISEIFGQKRCFNQKQVGVHVTSEDSINKFKITDTKKSTRGRNPKVSNQVNLVQNFIQNVESMNLLQNSTVPGGIVQNVTNVQTEGKRNKDGSLRKKNSKKIKTSSPLLENSRIEEIQ
ncbi:hypothetical protein ACTFIY_008204 [Dictyostelium cf. discoideum]